MSVNNDLHLWAARDSAINPKVFSHHRAGSFRGGIGSRGFRRTWHAHPSLDCGRLQSPESGHPLNTTRSPTAIARVCVNLPYAWQRFEQALNALFATLTDQPLVTDDFKRGGLKHAQNVPLSCRLSERTP